VFIGGKERRGGKIFRFGVFFKFLVGHPDDPIRFSFFEFWEPDREVIRFV